MEEEDEEEVECEEALSESSHSPVKSSEEQELLSLPLSLSSGVDSAEIIRRSNKIHKVTTLKLDLKNNTRTSVV